MTKFRIKNQLFTEYNRLGKLEELKIIIETTKSIIKRHQLEITHQYEVIDDALRQIFELKEKEI